MKIKYIFSVLCLSLMFFASSREATAAFRTVDTVSDSAALTACTGAENDCSLRGAISGAASGDIIQFSEWFYETERTINVPTPIVIDKSLQIRGPSPNLLKLTGIGNSSFILDFSGGNSELSAMTFADMSGTQPIGVMVQGNGTVLSIQGCLFRNIIGTTTGGAAIMASTGSLVFMHYLTVVDNTVGIASASDATAMLTFVHVENNFRRGISCESSANISFSTIVNNNGSTTRTIYVDTLSRSVTISNSLIAGNNNSRDGGGVSHLSGNLEIYNTTFSGNSSPRGGAIYSSFAGNLKIINSTITNNNSPNSAAVDIGVSIPVAIRNTIIAGNTGTQYPDVAGNVGTTLNNLVGIVNPAFTGFVSGGNPINNNLVGTAANPLNPQLLPLGNNGGSTGTHALLANSPAVNAGNNCVLTGCSGGNAALTFDARGSGFPRRIGSAVDIGAIEYTTVEVLVTNEADSGAGSLREAIANAPFGGTIIFDPNFFNQPRTITLTSGEILIDKYLNINGTGANLLTIDASNTSRIFNIANGVTAIINKVRLSRGNVGLTLGNNGGGILNNGALNLYDSAVSNCSADYGGAIFNAGQKTANIVRSTLNGNQANHGGGFSNHGSASFTNSTVSGNTASSKGGGIYNDGRFGIYNNGQISRIEITNTTVTENTVATNLGGGMRNEVESVFRMRNSIVAGNRSASAGADTTGVIDSLGYNLIGDMSGTTITGTLTGNILNVSARLAPLGNYGGSMPTHALIQNSPAINVGDPTNSFAIDQRGSQRVIGGRADIGAFEQNVIFDQNSLPSGNLSVIYNQQLSATRQTSLIEDKLSTGAENLAPNVFEIVPLAGQSLPPGINLSPGGLLSGTPMTVGTYNFTVKAIDTDGMAGVRQYAIQIFAPTAANASISGKVLTPDGRGLPNAQVTLTDSNGIARTVRSNSFGYYRFEEIPTSATYILVARSKGFQFQSRVITIFDEMTDLNIIGE